MKSSFILKNNNKIKGLDANHSLKIKKVLKKKKKFNKSVIYNISSLKKDIMREIIGRHNEKDEISLLSNANINIIKILNSCANDDFLNDSSFIINNDDQKDKSIESITKWKNRMRGLKNSPIQTYKLKKNSQKSINNIFIFNSNISDFSSESIFTDNKKNDTIKSPQKISTFSNKKISTKDISIEDKTKKKKLLKHSIEPVNINKLSNIGNIGKKTSNGHRGRSKSIVSSNNNYLNRKLDKYKNNNKTPSPIREIENNMNYKGFLSEIEIMKVNENVANNINFIQLKKKISQLKKSFQNKNEFKRFKTKKTNKSNKSNKSGNGQLNKINTIEEHHNSAHEESSFKNDNLQNENNYTSINNKLNSSIHSNKKKSYDKYRLLIRRKEIYDSIDDEEYREEEIDYYISPDNIFIKIFDSLLFISSLIYFIFVPYFLSKNYFIHEENKSWKIIFMMIDIIYILDVIINFFRAYHNFDENLIRKTKKIFFHYLKTWFLFDLIQAIPFFSIIKFLENHIYNDDKFTIPLLGYHTINPRIYIILFFKIIKLYKMFNGNSTISYFGGILSRNEMLDDHGGIILTFFITLFVLNLTTCLFIFLGINVYPGWILKLNIQDKSYLYIYLTSVYFVIVTITTVGYGDITGDTYPEIIFQIFLLIVGTIAYSFTISYISNYIIKSNQKSMSFEKNLEILQEIKIQNPNMKNSLYSEVLRNLYNEQLYERKDKHLLFDCLPYSLKNKLIMEMYKHIIKNFVFFKEIDNSDFIVKVITSLKPLISFKGDILIQEGDYIKEIFFVKKGVIGLNICIDLLEPELSLKKYFGKNEIGKFDVSYMKSSLLSQKKTLLEKKLNYFLLNDNEKKIEDSEHVENMEYIKIIEIRAREHFGDALMFLNERCPIVAKVRTRSAELLILRKIEAIEIYSIYPNIWKRINKKALYNMEQIYLKIKKIVIELANRYNMNIDNYLNKKKIRSNLKKTCLNNINNLQNNNVDNVDEDKKAEQNKDNSKIVLLEKKEEIVEFNENENMNQNNQNNLNISTNTIENMTFLKNNDTQKESVTKNIFEKKNSIFKNSMVSNGNNTNKIKEENLNSNKAKINNSLKNANIPTSNPLIKLNSLNSCKSKEKHSNSDSDKYEVYQRNSSICPNVCITNASKGNNETLNSNYSSDRIKSKLYKKLITKKEKIYYNTFTSLKTTKNSFQLNSSYDNINTISNNKYIKDINLQNKIRQVLINECNNKIPEKKKKTFLELPFISTQLCQTPKSTSKNLYKNFQSSVSEMELAKSQNEMLASKDNNKNNLINKSMTFISNNERNESGKNILKNKIQKNKLLSTSGLIEIKRINNNNKLASTKNISDFKKTKTPVLEPIKIKKKEVKINKQLNKISKNIKNTSKNINNPEEFYMNFFNNIIAKESKSINGDENDKNSNILNFNSGNKLRDNILSRQNSNVEINLLDSFISNRENNKDSNTNLFNNKTKPKNGSYNS